LLGERASDAGIGGDDLGSDGGSDAAGGPSWSQVTSPTTQTLRCVWVDANGGWAVGDASTVLRFDGHSWSSSNAGVPDLTYAFDALWSDGSAVYIGGEHAGGGVGFGWNGSSWIN